MEEKAPLTFKDRLLIEKQQLDERLDKLKAFLEGDKFSGLSNIQKSLLQVQAPLMLIYSQVLFERIKWLEMPPTVLQVSNSMLPAAADMKGLLSLLAEYGGSIISSNDLHPDLIAQARASNRIYVDENSLGYVWEPKFISGFPTTPNEVVLFERCYPINEELPTELSFENIWKRIKRNG